MSAVSAQAQGPELCRSGEYCRRFRRAWPWALCNSNPTLRVGEQKVLRPASLLEIFMHRLISVGVFRAHGVAGGGDMTPFAMLHAQEPHSINWLASFPLYAPCSLCATADCIRSSCGMASMDCEDDFGWLFAGGWLESTSHLAKQAGGKGMPARSASAALVPDTRCDAPHAHVSFWMHELHLDASSPHAHPHCSNGSVLHPHTYITPACAGDQAQAPRRRRRCRPFRRTHGPV